MAEEEELTQNQEVSSADVKVINLTEKTLDPATVNLLCRGLKFSPTPKSNDVQLASDIRSFSRKLRLMEYFKDSDNESNSDSLFKNASTFNPPRGRNRSLDACTDHLFTVANSLIENDPQNAKKSNLRSSEREALNKLRSDKSVIIKNADKGGAVVIMNTAFYQRKITEMLNDESTYIKVDANRDIQTWNEYRKFIKKYEKCFTKSEIKYLTEFEWRSSQLYGLPKVHKSKTIKEHAVATSIHVPSPEDITFRPIVGGPICPTNRLSQTLDLLLKPYVRLVTSYISDTTDFLNSLPDTVDDCELLTFDVKSLYTNINTELGLTAIEFWIRKYPDLLHARFSAEFVLEGLRFILENNVFIFNDQFYLQVSGTAMGTKVAPNYATLTVGYKEIRLYKEIEEERGIEMAVYIKDNLKRFLDDIFTPWLKRFGSKNYLLDKLNSLDENLVFELESSPDSIPFLDTQVYLEDGRVNTDIYYKSTDAHNYLRFDSCHPKHTKVNIPFSQAQRICKIVSDQRRRDVRLEELKRHLLAQKYPITVITKGIDRAKLVPREELLKRRPKEQKRIIPFSRTYNPNNENVNSVIKDSLKLLKASGPMKELLESQRVVNCYKSAPSLGRILVSSKFSTREITHKGVVKCGGKTCGCCAHIVVTKKVKFENDFEFEIRNDMDCDSKNVIYVIKCSGCTKTYIGQTGDKLRNRVRVHRQHVNDSRYRILRVSQHIADCTTRVPAFYITPFYKMGSGTTDIERECKELFFIKRFKPSLNQN